MSRQCNRLRPVRAGGRIGRGVHATAARNRPGVSGSGEIWTRAWFPMRFESLRRDTGTPLRYNPVPREHGKLPSASSRACRTEKRATRRELEGSLPIGCVNRYPRSIPLGGFDLRRSTNGKMKKKTGREYH